ncbi:MAG: hypothetical protein KAJ42_04545 [Gemmatimonadetes bacterium]|nr:hypothetical protein [Gemmatimonadota bacterium]
MARLELSFDEVQQDPQIRDYFGTEGLAGARLAESAGMKVYADAVLVDDMGIEGAMWHVEVPDDVANSIQAMVWDDQYGMSETLTRSTRGPFWQLTRWARDGGPWGHADIHSFEGAFDSSAMASGATVGRLRQIVFDDGRVLTREGTTAINPPNDRLKRRLMR